ncbi:MAG: hypothetical protein K0Q71_4569, partial [Thermomicrobiales bacterium]|nr:hypothetical protein [Thermomicrobiales bacterium]
SAGNCRRSATPMPARKSSATPKRIAGNAAARASLRVPSAVRGSALSRAVASGRSIQKRASADAGRASGNAPTGRASPRINAVTTKSRALAACAFPRTSAVLARNAATMAHAFLRTSAVGTTPRRVAAGAIGWSASTASCNANPLPSDGRAGCEGAITARAAMANARRKRSSAPPTRIDVLTSRPARARARAAGPTFRGQTTASVALPGTRRTTTSGGAGSQAETNGSARSGTAHAPHKIRPIRTGAAWTDRRRSSPGIRRGNDPATSSRTFSRTGTWPRRPARHGKARGSAWREIGSRSVRNEPRTRE